ncbi:MAG: 50S ribosomal protein L21 [Gammaproteobacteria bacterium]|nr:50S ribosomal protein L21 [Gammaproteobacteria bacterium]
MYAVFKTGGKQYKASKGDVVRVEKIQADAGQTVDLDQVLMVRDDQDKVVVGTPMVKGGKVTAKVVAHGRADKIRIIKFRRRKHSRRTQGHRQYYTDLEITGISA